MIQKAFEYAVMAGGCLPLKRVEEAFQQLQSPPLASRERAFLGCRTASENPFGFLLTKPNGRANSF
jgi:hypothetical protein